MDSPGPTYDESFTLPVRRAVLPALLDIATMFDLMNVQYQIKYQIKGEHREVVALSLGGVLKNKSASRLSFITKGTDYLVCVTSRFGARPPVLRVRAYGQASRELLEALEREIQQHASSCDRHGPARLWAWFRSHVWGGIVAGLFVAGILAFPWVEPLIR